MSNANESAFPKAELVNDPSGLGQGILDHGGLTKREYFSALAMQGILSASYGWPSPDFQGNKELIATFSVIYADALLAALEGK